MWHSNKLQQKVAAFEEHDVDLVCYDSMTVTDSLEPVYEPGSSLDLPYKSGRIRAPQEGIHEPVHQNVVQGAMILCSAELANRSARLRMAFPTTTTLRTSPRLPAS